MNEKLFAKTKNQPIVSITVLRKHRILSPLNKHADSKHLYTHPPPQTHILSSMVYKGKKLNKFCSASLTGYLGS